MQQPEELYELDPAVTPDVNGAAMLVHLEGFMDAGRGWAPGHRAPS